jgi:hypothetical protein
VHLQMRSLLSSTDSSRNLVESGKFLEFQRNQFWQRDLPNRVNNSGRILNIIQIPPECRNYPQQNHNGMESVESVECPMMPKSSVSKCQHLIWVSSKTTNIVLPEPSPLSTTTTILHHTCPVSLRHQWSPPRTTVTHHPQ